MYSSQKNQNVKQKMKATSAMIFQESQVKHKIERETELKLQKLNQQTTLTKVDENNICLIDQ